MYDAVLKAQLAAIDAVRPGVTAAHVDRAARRVLGIGRAWEKSSCIPPAMAWAWKFTRRRAWAGATRPDLRPGMVITIEPGAYIRGFGGIRIEDTVLVTKNGCEVLTPTSKELILL